MPTYPVRQPDRQLAIYSTIVDNFLSFNNSVEEAVDMMAERYHIDREKLRKDCQQNDLK